MSLADRGASRRALPPALARSIIQGLLHPLEKGHLSIEEAGRPTRTFGPAGAGLKATITVHRPEAWSATLGGGSVGLGWSFMQGWWDADDLTSLVRILIGLLPDDRGRLRRLGRSLAPLSTATQTVTRAGREHRDPLHRDRLNIRAHYDLSNEFFAAFLDPTMSYSCGYFEEPGASLEEASVAKIDRLCRMLRLEPGQHLLEIGTGWGALALHAATHYGVRVTTTTISERQYEYARQLVAERGLSDRVTVLDLDYRRLTGRFDRLVSVEMIEAVDWRQHDTFFHTCARRLAPDGLMALQAIVVSDQAYERSKRKDDFIRRVIFPGGCLPSVTAITRSLTSATDLRVIGLEDIGAHYPATLSAWRANLHAHRDRVEAMGFDAAFQRMWEFYLSYCEGGFLERRVSDVQMVMAGPDWRP